MNTETNSPIPIEEIYRQQYAHFSKMNELLYKLPIGFSTILGGLWFFGASMIGKDKLICACVFVFSAVCSLTFMAMMFRFRAALNGYLDNLNEMDGEHAVSINYLRFPSTIKSIIFLLCCASIISALATIYVVI